LSTPLFDGITASLDFARIDRGVKSAVLNNGNSQGRRNTMGISSNHPRHHSAVSITGFAFLFAIATVTVLSAGENKPTHKPDFGPNVLAG